MRRIRAALTPVLALAVLATGCSGSSHRLTGAERAADALADALVAAADPDTPADEHPLASLTFAGVRPAAVAGQYADIVAGMDGRVPEVSVSGVKETNSHAATATLSWSWPVLDGHPWRYTSQAHLGETDGTWAVRWEHSLVAPDLGRRQVLDAVGLPAPRGRITGADGAVLVRDRPVVRYGIDKVRVHGSAAAQDARRLAELVGIDVAAYVKAVRAAGERAFVEAIAYRKGEVPPEVSARASSLPGVAAYGDTMALAPTREFAAPILGRVGPVTAEMVKQDPTAYRPGDIAGISGLQARYDDQLRGTPGVVVRADDPTSLGRPHELFRVRPVAGKPLGLTLDPKLQRTAEGLLAHVGPASAIVAIRPSDGSVLAAANGPGTNGQNYATYGRFAPGSTFKIVTSLALIRAGLTPDSRVTCTSATTVDGKRFENYDDYPASALGRIPLRTAVANSCNTAFISQRGRLGDGDLASAAASLGLGIDHDLGFPAYFGQVPDPASDTEAAADLIGQGKVLASPMVMATVIASVQAGTTVVPHLVDGVDTAIPPSAQALTRHEIGQLRSMLRAVVTSGSGRLLAHLPGPQVIAKTGTAEFGEGGHTGTHAWMVAAQSDLAVAVFVDRGASGSGTAGPILADFLRAAQR